MRSDLGSAYLLVYVQPRSSNDWSERDVDGQCRIIYFSRKLNTETDPNFFGFQRNLYFHAGSKRRQILFTTATKTLINCSEMHQALSRRPCVPPLNEIATGQQLTLDRKKWSMK